jgi:hypothetical protein
MNRRFDRQQLEMKLEKAQEELRKKNRIIEEVSKWQKDSINKHSPMVNSIDLGIPSDIDELKGQLLERIEKEVFCASCRSSWPCKLIPDFQKLYNIIRYEDNFEAEESKVESGVIPVRL